MIAYRYGTIAKVVPQQLEGQAERPEPLFGKVTFWILFASNIVSAALYGITAGLYYSMVYQTKEVPAWLTDSKIVFTFWTRICGLISGVMLAWGVYNIRKFFKEKDAMDDLNAPMMWRHGLSFGLYLASSLATTIAMLFLNLHTNEDEWYNLR